MLFGLRTWIGATSAFLISQISFGDMVSLYHELKIEKGTVIFNQCFASTIGCKDCYKNLSKIDIELKKDLSGNFVGVYERKIPDGKFLLETNIRVSRNEFNLLTIEANAKLEGSKYSKSTTLRLSPDYENYFPEVDLSGSYFPESDSCRVINFSIASTKSVPK